MFETHDDAIVLPLSAEGTHYWSYVLLGLHIPIYFVEYRVTEGSESTREAALLSEPGQLDALAKTQGVTLMALKLLSPGHLNGTGEWQLEPLAKICELFDKDKPDERGEFAYHLKNGGQYVYNPFGRRHSELGNVRTLFQI